MMFSCVLFPYKVDLNLKLSVCLLACVSIDSGSFLYWSIANCTKETMNVKEVCAKTFDFNTSWPHKVQYSSECF